MFVGIVGSRNYPALQRVQAFVASLARKYPDAVVVSGGARGVDSAAEAAATTYGLDVVSFRPEKVQGGFGIVEVTADDCLPLDDVVYPSFGRAAFARNRLIVGLAEQVVAFTTWSRGTQHSIDLARALGKPVHIYNDEGLRMEWASSQLSSTERS